MSKLQSISFPDELYTALSNHPDRKDFRSFSALCVALLAQQQNVRINATFAPGRKKSDSQVPGDRMICSTNPLTGKKEVAALDYFEALAKVFKALPLEQQVKMLNGDYSTPLDMAAIKKEIDGKDE